MCPAWGPSSWGDRGATSPAAKLGNTWHSALRVITTRLLCGPLSSSSIFFYLGVFGASLMKLSERASCYQVPFLLSGPRVFSPRVCSYERSSISAGFFFLPLHPLKLIIHENASGLFCVFPTSVQAAELEQMQMQNQPEIDLDSSNPIPTGVPYVDPQSFSPPFFPASNHHTPVHQ